LPAVLTWVSTTGSPTLGFIYLFVFSLGMTALLVLVGVFSGVLARLPRSGTWMVWIKRVAGVILLIMAQYYFVQAGMVWCSQLLATRMGRIAVMKQADG
jgi:cytochrome c-type biogenesis protein